MLQKDKAINDIEKSFKDYSDLMIKQLNELESIVQSGLTTISEQDLKTIQANEDKLNKFEVKISEKIINTIVLYHPVASELRRLMACYRIVVNMERIGDLVEDIIWFISKIEDTKLYADLSDVIFNMIASSNSMVEKAILSFINDDKDSAIWTIKNDEVIDQMNKKLIKKGIKKSKLQDEARIMLLNLLDFKSVVSKIERIGDHAGHIAEASIFSNEGVDIRHKNIDDQK